MKISVDRLFRPDVEAIELEQPFEFAGHDVEQLPVESGSYVS